MRGSCPFLPEVTKVWRAADMRVLKAERDGDYYLGTLCYAQSLLMEGKPAQALLQITKSLSVDLDDLSILTKWPPSYQAKRWIFENCREEGTFLGNPVRHYQHLASRMSGPLAELRSLRAWACFHLAEIALPEFSRDEEQIDRERLEVPELSSVLRELEKTGWPQEVAVFREAYAWGEAGAKS